MSNRIQPNGPSLLERLEKIAGSNHKPSIDELEAQQPTTPSDKQKKWLHAFLSSATVWILDELAITPRESRVLICVVHAAGQNKPVLICSKTQAEMVHITGLGRTTVYRALKRLCDLDILADVSMDYHRPQFMVHQLSEWKPAAWKPDSKVYKSILSAGVENA
jgi:hypothetical protein